MFVALLGFLTLIGDGAAAAPKDERPLPWLGFGKDGGLIILSQEKMFDVPNALEMDEARAYEAAALAKWLGPKAAVVAVDTRREKNFYVEGAPVAGSEPRVGQRFEVSGVGASCIVEVTGGMRAVLRFTDQFDDDDEPISVVYRGPGERVPPKVVANNPSVVTPADLTSSYGDQTPRFVGLKARIVEGMCPPDGVVAAPGQLVPAPIRKGEPALADAVRNDFRANKYIVTLEKQFRDDLTTYGAKSFDGCVDGAVPQHLDAFKSGMRTRIVEPQGQPPLLLVEVGSDSRCDPSRAAIVYRRKGDAWVHARDLWGGATQPFTLDLVLQDTQSKHTWIAGPPIRFGAGGWDWTITALDVGGLGRTVGGWADVSAHYCNYSDSAWEFAAVCRLPEE